MTSRRKYPTCALIVPATATWLAQKARDEHDALLPPNSIDDQISWDWEFVLGTKKHSAIWDFDPAGELFYEIAPKISKLVKGTVYIAQLHEHMFGCYAFEEGKSIGQVPEHPEKLALELGVPFPEPEPVSPTKARSLCIVEGVGPEAVRSAIEVPFEDRETVKIQPHPLGSMIFAKDE